MATKAQWREAGIVNPHLLIRKYVEETGKVGVYLAKRANDGSRMNMGSPHGWIVYRPGFKTASGAPDDWHGNAAFQLFHFHRSWDEALEAAQAWAVEKYSLEGGFDKIPGFGSDIFPIDVVNWAKAWIKEQLKAQ